MFRNFLYLAVGAMILTGCVSVHETKHVTETKAAKQPDRLLRHVVLLKFKDGTSEEHVRQIEDAFCALPDKIDAIYDLEWGTNISVENLSQGFTHCFLVTFLSEEDRAAYLPHPAHKAFGKLLSPYLDKVLVIDYWAK